MIFPPFVLRKFTALPRVARHRNWRFCRPSLEPLEERWVPSLTNPGNNVVIPKVQLQAIYYNDLAGQPALPKAQLDDFLTSLSASSYINQLNQYSTPTQKITTGSSLPGYDTNIAITSTINFNSNDGVAPTSNYNGVGVYDNQIQAAINSALDSASPSIANDGINKLFVVYLPAGVGASFAQGNATLDSIDTDGYHSSYLHDGKYVRYAVIFYPGSGGGKAYSPLTAFQQLTEVTSREVAESITNPDGISWADPRLGTRGEVGDLESLNYSTLNGYVVQDLWSNAASGPMRPAGTSLFINSFANPNEGPFSGAIATFTDRGAGAGVSYTALVDWGDGSPVTNATVTPAGDNTFTVTGQHTFTAEEGTKLNPQVWITSSSGEQAHAAGQVDLSDGTTGYSFNDLGLVTLQDAPLTPLPVTVNLTQGSSLNNQLVGQFADPATDGTNADYTATLTWVDSSGNTHGSAGTISATPTGNVFSVYGTDTTPFSVPGNYKVSVLVADRGTSTTIVSTAVVARPSVSVTGGFSFTDTENIASASETVATFTDPAGPGPIGDYSADISWGDGSESTNGTISFDGTSTYTVKASHTYTAPGNDTITVIIHRLDGLDATTTSSAAVDSDLNFTSALNTTGSSISISGTGLADGDTIMVAATDGTHSASANTTVSGGLWSVSGLDISQLANGWISFSVTETNSSSGGVTVQAEGIKGPPLGFTSTPNITDANVTDISLSGTGAFDGDTIRVSITDGSHATNAVQTTVSGGMWSVSGIDASGLDDGAIIYSLAESDNSNDMAVSHQASSKKTGSVTFTSAPIVTIDNQKTITVSGTGSNGDVVSVTITDGTNTTTAATAVVSNKTWSVSGISAADLADGTVTYSVTETNSAGDSTTITQAATKLTVAPALAFTSTPNITFASVGSVAAAGTGDNGDTIALSISDGSHTTATATTTVSGGTWSVSGINITGLADGAVAYTVTETDSVGNATTILQSAAKITAPPNLSLGSMPDINLANVGGVIVSGTGDNGDTISVILTGADSGMTPAATTVVSGGTWTAPPIDASILDDGSVIYNVNETDALGNESYFGHPGASKQVVLPAFAFSSTPVVNLTNYQDVTVSGTGDNGELVAVTLGDGTNTTTPALAQVRNGTWSVSGIDASTLADGTITYTAVQSDGLGGSGTITQDVAKDTAAPHLAFTSAPNINITNKNGVLVTGTGDNGDVVSVTIADGSTTTTAATATVSGGTWSVTIDPTSLRDGSITYAAATTVMGNTTTITQNATKILVVPAVAFTSTPNIATANQHGVTVTGTGDNGDTVSVTITDGVHTTTAATATVSGGSWSAGNIDAAAVADGTVTYAVTETDAAGNTTAITQSASKTTVPAGTPVVTPSLASLAANATTLIIQGSSFSTTPGKNIVKFGGGATGTVTHATATQLTVTSLAGLTAGSLSVTVTVGSLASVAEPVATVLPVVTVSKATLPVKATTLVIHGAGFSTTAANDTVTFSNGATGKVTHATATTLMVTALSGAPAGSLSAMVSSNGVSSTGYVQVAIVPITAPKVSYSADSTTQITLSWNAVPGATSYVVQQLKSNGKWATLDTLDGSTTKQAITVQPTSTNTYRVGAVDAYATAFSTPLKATSLALAPMVNATAVAGTEIQLNWNSLPGTTEYLIEEQQANGKFTPLYRVPPNMTTATFIEPPGGTNVYKVVSVGGRGILNFTSNTTSVSVINLNWNAVAGATAYEVDEQQADGSWAKIAILNGATTHQQLIGLPGNTYTFRVGAIDAGGVDDSASVVVNT